MLFWVFKNTQRGNLVCLPALNPSRGPNTLHLHHPTQLFSTKKTQQISLNLPIGYMGVLQIYLPTILSHEKINHSCIDNAPNPIKCLAAKDLSSLQALQLLLKFHSEVLEIVDLQKAKAWHGWPNGLFLRKRVGDVFWLLSMASQPTPQTCSCQKEGFS